MIISSIIPMLPPSVIMLAGALLLPMLNRPSRLVVAPLIPLMTLLQIWSMPVGINVLEFELAGFSINPLYASPYTHIFATIFAIAAFAGAIYGLLQSKITETSSAFLYAGSAIGVTFSGDFISLFVYWEMMTVGSTLIVFASDHHQSMRAGMRYAFMHFFGGVILMTGIIAHIILSGGDTSLTPFVADMAILFPDYSLDKNAIVIWLILIGVLINAAAPPLSAWLPDAYPRSSEFGAVFLSAFTTKTAVYVLITLFAGTELLIYVGLFMVFYGIIYAMLENDMRRILSYSIVNQVGFMVTAVGIGTDLALNGAATHAFVHIIYKALLFMSAGSVLYMTGKSKCTELGGLYRSMPVTTVCGIIGALAISAFPFTSGFITKSMITSAAIHEHMGIVWILLLAASAGVLVYAGIKFPWFVFFNKDSGMRPKDPPFNMQIAMIFFAALCILPAIPGWAEMTIYKLLPSTPDYHAYTTEHVVTQLQLLLFSGLAFFVMLPLLKRTETISLDFDWFYRIFARYIIVVSLFMVSFPARIAKIVSIRIIRKFVGFVRYTHSPNGVMARSWALGTVVMWTLGLLAVYLVIYYL